MQAVTRALSHSNGQQIGSVLMATGAVVLAAEPALWLANSWSDPVWNSNGWMMAIATCALLLWSLSSPRRFCASAPRRAWLLLGLSALVRLTSQVLGINVIGALTLAVDVYAIALLLGTDHRVRGVSAFWIGCLFVLALPLERVIQRVLGFGLQLVSADGACAVLGLFGFAPVCNGVEILLDGENVLVDVPCSGVRGLLMIVALFLVVAAIRRPMLKQAVVGMCLTLGCALAANTLRIVLLALGLTQEAVTQHVNVMEAPWHELIGTAALLLGVVPVVLWARHLSARVQLPGHARLNRRRIRPGLAFSFFVFALIVVSLPARPVDVSAPTREVVFPAMIDTDVLEPLPLNAIETEYFTQYGGQARRGRYGDKLVLTVNTTSPLRHLHSPDECLRATGHTVRYLGIVDGVMPSGLYRSVDPTGQAWSIRVSFISSAGHVTTNVAHAVWLWMRQPGMQWTMVQRIKPFGEVDDSDRRLDTAFARLLDVGEEQISTRSNGEQTRGRTSI